MGAIKEALQERSPRELPVAFKCFHCGDSVPLALQKTLTSEGHSFCCEGCRSVHFFLKSLGEDGRFASVLDDLQGSRPLAGSNEDFSALDLPPHRAEAHGKAYIDLFLEGIHCSSCVWIVERLPEMDKRIVSARLDIGRSVVRVWVSEVGRFEDVAILLMKLGYRPSPVRSEKESEKRVADADRLTLKRMGVAAFSAMNVMIYSFSLYSGVDGSYAWLFRILSLAISLPALTYSAFPFYQSALRALRNRRISIDLPISIAFIAGFLESVRQTILGTNLLYLDSLTSLVFLMLLSRYALSRLERAELSKSGLLQALLPQRVWKISHATLKGSIRVRARVNELCVGDEIELETNDKLPADGRVTLGTGYLDLSFLTGESRPIRVAEGDQVFAGSRLLDGCIRFRVTELGRETRLGTIEARLDSYAPKKNSRTERSDRWAGAFLAVVIGLSVVFLFSFGKDNSVEAIRRSLSLLIIACPCALALATPLALSRAFRLASSKGILIRDLDVFERLLKVDQVIFDKTGTLTEAKAVVTNWKWCAEVKDEKKSRLMSIALMMEERARHPYGRAIAEFLIQTPGVQPIHGFEPREEMGVGVWVVIDGNTFRLGRGNSGDEKRSSSIFFYEDSNPIAEIQVKDALRPDSKEVVGELLSNGLKVEILSGDGEEAVVNVSQELHIPKWQSRMSPEKKGQYLTKMGPASLSLFVGDGVNDALALREAYVGVALNRNSSGAAEVALESADVALLRPDLKMLPELLKISRRYRKTLLRGATFSVFYNLVGAGFAVTGHIHPLVAAIAMPVSALTLFLSTVSGLSDFESEEK